MIAWRWAVVALGALLMIAGITYSGRYQGLFGHVRGGEPAHPPTMLGRVLFVAAGLLFVWLGVTGRV